MVMDPQAEPRRPSTPPTRPRNLEVRQLLSLTDPVPASSPAAFPQIRTARSIDKVIQAGSARSTFGVDGSGQNVAVIDTGVDFKNPAFGSGGVGQPGNKVVAGVDFTGAPTGSCRPGSTGPASPA